jgi:hypothetical protein
VTGRECPGAMAANCGSTGCKWMKTLLCSPSPPCRPSPTAWPHAPASAREGVRARFDERTRLRFSRISIARCADLVRCSASASSPLVTVSPPCRDGPGNGPWSPRAGPSARRVRARWVFRGDLQAPAGLADQHTHWRAGGAHVAVGMAQALLPGPTWTPGKPSRAAGLRRIRAGFSPTPVNTGTSKRSPHSLAGSGTLLGAANQTEPGRNHPAPFGPETCISRRGRRARNRRDIRLIVLILPVRQPPSSERGRVLAARFRALPDRYGDEPFRRAC